MANETRKRPNPFEVIAHDQPRRVIVGIEAGQGSGWYRSSAYVSGGTMIETRRTRHSRRARWGRIAIATVAGTALVAGHASPSSAQSDNPLTGQTGCNIITGNQIVTWTFTNESEAVVDITGAALSGATTGPAVFQPSQLTDAVLTATVTTEFPNSVIGLVTMTVNWEIFDDEIEETSVASVTMNGTCVGSGTTLAPTTVPPTSAPVTTAGPSPTTVRPSTTTVPIVSPRFTG